MGLREQIKNANSDSEIVALLKNGDKFEFVSEHTKRAWKSTARLRLSQLNNLIPTQTPTSPEQEKKQKVNKKNKK